jgi:hypothetical protein
MIHGVVEGDHHMVVDDGIIISVAPVMVHGVRLVVGDLTEVEITMVVHGVPMGAEEGIMEVVEDPMGVVEVGVVGGMGVAIHHQDGKAQGEEDKEPGIGIGHPQDGMETKMSVSMATALHHHSVTEKVSTFRNAARYIHYHHLCSQPRKSFLPNFACMFTTVLLSYQFQAEN